MVGGQLTSIAVFRPAIIWVGLKDQIEIEHAALRSSFTHCCTAGDSSGGADILHICLHCIGCGTCGLQVRALECNARFLENNYTGLWLGWLLRHCGETCSSKSVWRSRRKSLLVSPCVCRHWQVAAVYVCGGRCYFPYRFVIFARVSVYKFFGEVYIFWH